VDAPDYGLDKDLINPDRDRLIPPLRDCCEFTLCEECDSIVLRMHHFDEVDIDEAGNSIYEGERFSKCKCLEMWVDFFCERAFSSLKGEEFFRELEKAGYRSRGQWQSVCEENDGNKGKVIPNIYYLSNTKCTFSNLEALLFYCGKNPSCKCYWPQSNEIACKISNTAYRSLVELIKKPTNLVLDEYVQEMPSLEGRSPDGAAAALVAHSFFYSQYHKTILKFIDAIDKNSVTGASSEISSIYSILDEIRPLFLRV